MEQRASCDRSGSLGRISALQLRCDSGFETKKICGDDNIIRNVHML